MDNNIKEAAERAIKFIGTVKELSEEEKTKYIERISQGESPLDILGEIEDYIQSKIDEEFDKAGIKVDEKDPEIQTAYKEMNTEMGAAEKEFDSEMAGIQKEADEVKEKASYEIDELKLQDVRAKIAEE